MKVSEFYYELPEELIAQEPAKERDASRLLVLHRNTGKIEHRIFRNVLDYMDKGDCMVLNDTRVIPARLLGRREDTGGKMEFVLLHKTGNDLWEVILKPGKRARPGARFVFGHQGELKAEIIDITDEGNRIARFEYEGIFEQVLEKVGVVPLPPYIKKRDVDAERYQTVYSRQKGSAAAPTAGLHFTADLLEKARERGIEIAYATLHIGLGTFRPVKAENVENHNMHQEFYSINREACEKINRAKKDGRRVIAVGTTSCRTIESAAGEKGLVCPASGWTGIFIYPGYKFKVMDSLITNFHLPCSTLIMLVSAFAGKDAIMRAYQEAIKERYRFYSFGDAMLIV